ncbi:MAG: M16 family metallopeptidase [Planctomycetota bacterium]|jgi:predicted Zn-dependent peptidase
MTMRRVFGLSVACLAAALLAAPGRVLGGESGNPFRLPPFDSVVLDNGLSVFLMEQHEVPLTAVSLLLPAGAVHDGEKSGLASLTAEGLRFGTKEFSKEQIEETLDFLGVSFRIRTRHETVEVSLSFLRSEQDPVFRILEEIILRPAFPEEELAKRKQRRLVELKQAKQWPSRVVDAYYDRFLFGEHPLGNPVTGTRKGVEGITVEDVRGFYRDRYRPDGAVFAVVGDFETPKMKEKIAALFRAWKGKGKPSSPAKTPQVPEKARVLLVNKEDATETQFMIGRLGVPRNHPDTTAIQVVNTVLGGRFTSWLNDELRVTRGLTYGAGSDFNAHRTTGSFAMASFTETKHTGEAVDLALEILERLHRDGVDEKTLASAKNYMKGQFPPRYETSASLARLLTAMAFYGFDASVINEFEKRVDAMTPERARKIIEAYFPRKNLQFVLIGKAGDLRAVAKKWGEVTEKNIQADGY